MKLTATQTELLNSCPVVFEECYEGGETDYFVTKEGRKFQTRVVHTLHGYGFLACEGHISDLISGDEVVLTDKGEAFLKELHRFGFDKKITKNTQDSFVNFIMGMHEQIGFKVSSRGWAYLLELAGYIDKSQFDKIENAINRLRKIGKIPVDLIAEEAARAFEEVHEAEEDGPLKYIKRHLEYVQHCEDWYTPDWWGAHPDVEGDKDEEFYIQMIVEKIDLVTLFQPICKEYHIPIANAKGWSSISQRAEYTQRFAEAEERGMKCVLLYCGDHDPDGLRISDTIMSNLQDISNIRFLDGRHGWDPEDLIIHRFGLNYDFIEKHQYPWIDNLITGGKGSLAEIDEDGKIVQGRLKNGRPHPNFHLDYLQEYLREFGVRKCEANALVRTPEPGKDLCKSAIEAYLGTDALDRFRAREKANEARILDAKEERAIDVKLAEIEQALKTDLVESDDFPATIIVSEPDGKEKSRIAGMIQDLLYEMDEQANYQVRKTDTYLGETGIEHDYE